jgi:hypothetical protein
VLLSSCAARQNEYSGHRWAEGQSHPGACACRFAVRQNRRNSLPNNSFCHFTKIFLLDNLPLSDPFFVHVAPSATLAAAHPLHHGPIGGQSLRDAIPNPIRAVHTEK